MRTKFIAMSRFGVVFCVASLCLGLTMGLMGEPKAWAAGDYRTLSAKLPNVVKDGWRTHKWTQTRDAKDYPVGCGPTAWAVVYGYHELFNHKDKLFPDGAVTSNSGAGDAMIDSVTRKVAKLVKTDYYIPKHGVVKGKKSGGTQLKNMCLGIKWAKQQGYAHSRCFRVRGTEFNKYEHVARHLKSGRPVIMSLHDDPEREDTRGAVNHFVILEEAYLKQKRVAGKWQDRDVWYVVNDGNGSRREIWVREVGKNKHKIYSAFSMYFITVTDQELKGASDINSEACLEWCRGNKDCKACSKLPGCGPGYSPLKAFTGAGKDWYACEKRKSRQEASKDNKAACEEWCQDHPDCVGCSTKIGCGVGKKRMKSWTGRGTNYHACKKR